MQPAAAFPKRNEFSPIKIHSETLQEADTCCRCRRRELCLPRGLDTKEFEGVEQIVYARRRVKRGEALFHAGDRPHAVFAVREGAFKISVIDGEGREQVTGFAMSGDLLGMEGIGLTSYHAGGTALQDSEVCVIPLALLVSLAARIPGLQRTLHSALARDIVRDQSVMLVLGSMRAEERIAAFLLRLSDRLGRLGHSPTQFELRMTRKDIGNHLGIALETVSRVLARFKDARLIEFRYRQVRGLDRKGLKLLLAGPADGTRGARRTGRDRRHLRAPATFPLAPIRSPARAAPPPESRPDPGSWAGD